MQKKTLTKKEIRALEMIGFLFLNLGVVRKAESTINAILVVDPNNSWAFYARPILYFLKEDYETAIYFADIVLQMKNFEYDLLEIKKLKARALFMLNRQEESSKLIKEIKQEIDARSEIEEPEA
ncbi:hypothetical protein [Succinivibrio sp.]|jgi:tetratricopeptide (TPR) repeat protein|uniref:hypothetical protein n=1 Tax=Succinivibrio sp. TaxID=2053619 RepID=UPI0025D67C5A|nr:hypothetical protein [uncultured Succinivibrio sp.]